MGSACSSCPDGYTAFSEHVYKSTVCLCIQKQTVSIGDRNYTFLTDITSDADALRMGTWALLGILLVAFLLR